MSEQMFVVKIHSQNGGLRPYFIKECLSIGLGPVSSTIKVSDVKEYTLEPQAVAEIMETENLMDSYTQRSPKSKSIILYKPISELPVGTKLYLKINI